MKSVELPSENKNIVFFLLTLFITAVFWSVVFSRPLFFGGDDWYVFHNLSSKKSGDFITYLFTPHHKHIDPFNRMFIYAQLKLFNLHYNPFQLVNILLHLSVTAALFALINSHIKDGFVTFLSVIFFSINTAYYPQSVGWVIGQSVLLSMLFLLSALLSVNKLIGGGKVFLLFIFLFSLLSAFSSGSGLITPLIVLIYYIFCYMNRNSNISRYAHLSAIFLLILLQLGVVLLYLSVFKMEGILSNNLYIFNFSNIYHCTVLVLYGISALIFTSFGGKLLLLTFNVEPTTILSSFSLPADFLITAVAILFLVVLVFSFLIYITIHNRAYFIKLIRKHWMFLLFGTIFIVLIYGIRAAGRSDESSTLDFMTAHHYRYEPFLGISFMTAFLLKYFIDLFRVKLSKYFAIWITVGSILLLVIINIPIAFWNGHEFPSDRDFVKDYRDLLEAQSSPLTLWNAEYTFHDDISSSFSLYNIALMDDADLDEISFVDNLNEIQVMDKKTRVFYYVYFPDSRKR